MGEWIQRTSMPTPRHDLQAVTVGRQIYAISGGGDLTSDVIEIYDVDGDAWSEGPSMRTKRGWFGALLLDEKIYVVGGKTVTTDEEKAQSGDPAYYHIHDSFEVPDLPSHTWHVLEPLSQSRAGLVAAVCGGQIYALGGNAMDNETKSGGPHLDRVEVYNPASGHWSMGVPMPIGLQGPAVAAVDDRIYLTAGIGARTQVEREELRVRPANGKVGEPGADPHTTVRSGNRRHRAQDLHLRRLGELSQMRRGLRHRQRYLVVGHPHAGQQGLDGGGDGRRTDFRDGRCV